MNKKDYQKPTLEQITLHPDSACMLLSSPTGPQPLQGKAIQIP